jgi:hypothetical protein
MTDDQLRYRILSQLTEDYTGLWELAKTETAPRLDELIRVLDGMIKDGLVDLFKGASFSSEERVLPPPQARELIKNRAFWEWSAPERGEHIRALATRAGTKWYMSYGS